jgi:hypothetical protein
MRENKLQCFRGLAEHANVERDAFALGLPM